MKKDKGSWRNDYSRPISLGSVRKLIENARVSWLRSLVAFLWIYGTRIKEEALEMRKRDFDITEERVTARIPYSKRTDKKNRRHNVQATVGTPLIEFVINKVESIEEGKIWDRSYWSVWYNMKNNMPLDGTDMDREWITPHMFRHTRATKLAERDGVTALELQEFHGWKSVNTAQSYLEEAGRRAAKLEDKIGD